MASQLLLTVDLNSVNETQRQIFYSYLEKQNFEKTNLTTTWKASFTGAPEHTVAVNLIKQILADAASTADITNYEAQFMISANGAISVRK